MGVILNNQLTWDNEVGILCSNLHNRILNIHKLNNVTNFATLLNFFNAYVIGRMRYMLPLYMGSGHDNMNKLHKVLMRAARTARNNYCCKQSIGQRLGSCKWLPINKMIIHSALVTIHTTISRNTPKSIINL